MFERLKSSTTIWLGAVITGIGTVLDFLQVVETAVGGLPGVHQQFVDAGLDEHTIAQVFSVVGPMIVLARMRSLWRQP